MATAHIDGEEADIAEAARLVADLVRPASRPRVGVRARDALVTRAAMDLARAIGGTVDHAASESLAPFLATLADSGMMLGAPAEIRRRADRFLLVGPEALDDAGFADFLMAGEPDLGRSTRGVERQALWIAPPDDLPALPGSVKVERFDCEPALVGDVIACLRAARAGRPYAQEVVSKGHADWMVEWLQQAGFGCALFAVEGFDALDLELLSGLVGELNETTRFTSLPRLPENGAWEAAQAGASLAGFAPPVSFARGPAEPDSEGLLTGAADLAIVFDAEPGGGENHHWKGVLPAVAVATPARADRWRRNARVVIEMAEPGEDTLSVTADPRSANLVSTAGRRPSDARPGAEAVVAALIEAMNATAEDGVAA